MPREKKYHNDYCSNVCLGCLKRIKQKPRSLHNNESLSKLATDHLYSNFLEDRLFLPSAFCQSCNDRVKSPNPKDFPMVEYKLLVNHVKEWQSKVMSGEVDRCNCEICQISSTSINAQKSSFLIKEIKVGRPNIPKKPQMTDFFPEAKGSNKQETIKNIIEQVDTDSLDQVCAEHLGNKVQSPIISIISHRIIEIIYFFNILHTYIQYGTL